MSAPTVAVDCLECIGAADMFICPKCGTDGAVMVPANPPRLTRSEVHDVADLLAGSVCDDPSAAGTLSAVLQRRMNEANSREEQDRAGADVLDVWRST